MRRKNKKTRLCPALTIVETVISLSIMAVIFAVLLPQIRAIQNSWDSRAGTAETLQNGRVLIDHINRNLSKAVSITDVSDSSQTDGYIEFEDSALSTLRYDIAANDYVEFGTVGDLYDLAGPVSQLLFTCYDGNDLGTAITDGNNIRLVNVQATVTNPTAGGRDLTVRTSVYLRTGPLPGEVVDPNLILWLKLDETSGSTAADSSGNGNDGTLTNMDPATDWVAGQIGNALDFDGTNDFVDFASIDVGDTFTIAAWIKPDSSGTGLDTIVANSSNMATTDGFRFFIKDDGQITFETGNGSAGAGLLSAAGVINFDQWNHVAVEVDRASGSGTIYHDGVDVTVGGATRTDFNTTSDGEIGRMEGGFSEVFKGVIDDVRIYDYALSGAEIGALYYLSGPVYEEFTEAKLSSDGTSLTIPTPAGVVEGSLLIAAVATDGDTTSSLAPPAGEGWTQVFLNDQSSAATIGVWWKLADASESGSHEFTWSGGQNAYGWMMRVEGHDPADPIHVYSADGETSASPSSPPVTTTLDRCLILRLGAFDDDDILLDDPGLSSHNAITMDSSQALGVSYEEFTEAKAGSDANSLTINTPAGTAEGDLLIAAVTTDSNNKSSLSPPAGEGWTQIEVDDQGGEVTLGAWWKLAEASESSSHQFTWDQGEQAYGWMMRFTGHDPSNPIGDKGKLEGASSTPACPSVDTLAANSMVLRIGGFDDDDIGIDDPGLSGHAPITMDESSEGSDTCSGGAGYVLQASPGASGTSEFVLTGSEDYVCVTIAIEAAPPSGGGGVSGGAGYVSQASNGSSGFSSFSLTASQEARTVTIAIAPVP